jgi:hypothetical protein
VKTDIAEINFPLLPVIKILIGSRGFGWWITEIRIYAFKTISELTMARKGAGNNKWFKRERSLYQQKLTYTLEKKGIHTHTYIHTFHGAIGVL